MNGEYLLICSANGSITFHCPITVSVDYLLGEVLNAYYDKEMVKRLDELETPREDEQKHIFHYMDLVIRDYKTKKIYNPKLQKLCNNPSFTVI